MLSLLLTIFLIWLFFKLGGWLNQDFRLLTHCRIDFRILRILAHPIPGSGSRGWIVVCGNKII